MRNRLAVVLMGAAVLVAAGLAALFLIAPAFEAPDHSAAAGRQVFAQAGCGGCHSLAAAGSTGTVGPSLDERDPSAATVSRQVTNGGGGMPSFHGRLTDDQIAAVATFVSSRATGQAASGTSKVFHLSGQRVAGCASSDRRCLEQAYGNLAYRRGARVALTSLARQAAGSQVVAAQCHRITHGIGGATLARDKGEVGHALASGGPYCGSGFYHGVLDHAFAKVPVTRLGVAARRFCSTPAIRTEAFLAFNCLHGLGHGLMIRTGLDLPQALHACAALGVAKDRSVCDTGVFMENFFSSYGGQSPWVRSDNLLYPCTMVPRVEKSPCYANVTSWVLKHHRGDYLEVARWCARADTGFRGVCVQSLGRDISAEAHHVPAQVARGCEALPAADRAECFFGAARNEFHHDANPRRAVATCQFADGVNRERCFTAVGFDLPTKNPWAAKGIAACKMVGARADVVSCERGVRWRVRSMQGTAG
jgi:mono/diheme cytochrome c family protein